MNFDTRLILDIFILDSKLKEDIQNIVEEEQLFSDIIGRVDSDYFLDSVAPLIKDKLKQYVKRDIKKLDIPFVKSLINITNVDYRIIIDNVSES
jgi:hypothetical protein